MDLRFPYGFDSTGITAGTPRLAHIRQMIEQILLTAPGERVNRPNFGSGASRLVFEPNSAMMLATQNQLIQGALQQWLLDVVRVEAVSVDGNDSTVTITVQYSVMETGQPHTEQFQVGGGAV
ncbi:GPW/gp25 family protein [Terriglobus roseus]|uniref:IraD/Gp25-like domain-containing protein n=1 Tax=Terriglobus roseus TaxID=392734 RepID=A0A1H4IY41_9BACT|nr:GPW/gp25 family protein [Terriglobus roseus]SEB38745.1 hypothetical protein SAMN05443244_0178 [Terriglobus roseus]